MDVRRVADAGELADAAADEILERARAAVAERGRFHLALAGGSTPRRTYGARHFVEIMSAVHAR